MSRLSARIRARFAATVQLSGDQTLVCHTRDISLEGCFLETSESALTVGTEVNFSVFDNAQGEVVMVNGHVTRKNTGTDGGVGIRLADVPDAWLVLVDRFDEARPETLIRPNLRLSILVVSPVSNRRAALALYVTSGWDIRFADNDTAAEALQGITLDAIICECETSSPAEAQQRSLPVLQAAKTAQPGARRLVRCQLAPFSPSKPPEVLPCGPNQLIHRFVNGADGMDSLLDALSGELGELKNAMTDPITGALALSKTASHKLLQEIISVLCRTKDAIAVFDLDSTLLDNAPRQSAILVEYGHEFGIPALQNSLPEHWVSWDVADAMVNAGLATDLVKEHAGPFKDYWREKFFTSAYCKYDEMVPGAAHFVQNVRDSGGKIYYVTGRHEEMRAGSVANLASLGFPVPGEDEGVQLLMKPYLEEDDDVYKLRTYAHLSTIGTVVAAFDNEPTHINGYRNAFPDAYSIHLATDHSGRNVKIAEGITSITDFTAAE